MSVNKESQEVLLLEDYFKQFVPPPRFKEVTINNYIPRDTSQENAQRIVREFAESLTPTFTKKIKKAFNLKPKAEKNNLYLDGLYGVGKTHLLASLYYACPDESKLYLSFTELMYTIGMLGLEEAAKHFSQADLICIDEFELDDPGNTMMALGFLSRVIAKGVRIATTSNTLPDHLGKGRFASVSFERELKTLASYFQVVQIEGGDYRSSDGKKHREPLTWVKHASLDAKVKEAKQMSHISFLALLKEVHPIKYFQIVSSLKGLIVESLKQIDDQFDALRFVYFIDKMYDQKIPIAIISEKQIDDIFSPEFYKSAYAKKYLRCTSRLKELCYESGAYFTELA